MQETKEVQIWEDCKLGRETDALIIEKFVQNTLTQLERAGRPQSLVLNLDAPWGGGKTFFLNLFKEHLERSGHVVAYVDAWANDHSGDPFLTVVDELRAQLISALPESERNSKAKSFLKASCSVAGSGLWALAKHWTVKAIGQEAIELAGEAFSSTDADTPTDDAKEASPPKNGEKEAQKALEKGLQKAVDKAGQEVLQAFQLSKSVRQSFHAELSGLISKVTEQNSVQTPIYVFVDELDRCRPDYSVELLESIKHLFSANGLVFVLATDSEQLVRAVKGVFGADIDGSRYLERFIDRTYRFQSAKMNNFIERSMDSLGMSRDQYSPVGDYSPIDYFSSVFEKAGTPLRTVEKILAIMSTFEAAWPYGSMQINSVCLLNEICEQYLPAEVADRIKNTKLDFMVLARDRPQTQASSRGSNYIKVADQARFIDSSSLRPEAGGKDSFEYSALEYLISSFASRMNPNPIGFPVHGVSIAQQYREILARVVRPL